MCAVSLQNRMMAGWQVVSKVPVLVLKRYWIFQIIKDWLALGNLRVGKDWQFEAASSLSGLPGQRIWTTHGLWERCRLGCRKKQNWISWWCSWFPEPTHDPAWSRLSSWPGSSRKHPQHESRAALPGATKETALRPGLRPLLGTSKGSFLWFPHIVWLLHDVSIRFLVPPNPQPSSACHADYASTDLGRWRQMGNASANANKWGNKLTVCMCKICTKTHYLLTYCKLM